MARTLKITLVLLAAALLAAGIWVAGYVLDGQGRAEPIALSCDPVTQPCRIDLEQGAIEVRVSGAVQPLKPFRLAVVGDSLPDTGQLWVRFDMVGMEMGYNRYPLSRVDQGFAGDIVLPVCTAARNDWTLHIELQEALQLALPFTVR